MRACSDGRRAIITRDLCDCPRHRGLALLLRSFVYLRYEQLAFDSDQAITGLMAKHLVDARAFPLFFYGQTYMLAVEAWAAAPWFLLFGPTVTALRLSLLAWNVAFGGMLVLTLHRDNRLSPWLALCARVDFPARACVNRVAAHGGAGRHRRTVCLCRGVVAAAQTTSLVRRAARDRIQEPRVRRVRCAGPVCRRVVFG